jgi:hypothetical protein
MKYIKFAWLWMTPALCSATSPDCASWPTNVALVRLKNAGIVDTTNIDASKTKAILLASQPVGRDLYQQVYDITFYGKSGRLIQVVTHSQASSEECSMSSVDVYVVSQKLGGP